MTDTGPRLKALRSWAKREGMCLGILERALELLRMEEGLPEAEVGLNHRLYFCIITASRELYPADKIAPMAESNNQPDPDDASRAACEWKKPDFQWGYLDRYEPDPKRSGRQFVVECKRLGKPCRADWIFNVNYVVDGICRFRDPKWAYARRFRSGAMVGYLQSMNPRQVLKEVNDEVRRNSLPDLVPTASASPRVPGRDRLDHTFDRPFEVSPFHLHHLWVDLRQAIE